MQAIEPQIAELLRTTIHPPSLLLRIVDVEFVKADAYRADATELSLQNDKTALHFRDGYLGKFLLSDGELMIQALLHRRLTGIQDIGSVEKGDILDIRKFTVNKALRLNGRGKVLFLGIEDCTFLLRSSAEKLKDETSAQQPTTLNVSSKKRTRTVEQNHEHAYVEHDPNDTSGDKLAARSSPKRLRMSLSQQDDSLLPSSMPSTPPLSLKDLDDFSVQNVNDVGKQPVQSSTQNGIQLAEDRISTRRSSDYLSRTFGARRVACEDEDDDDNFFESIQAIRTPAEVARPSFRKSAQSTRVRLGSDEPEAITTLDAVSPKLLERNAQELRGKEMAEPHLPPQPVSRRDGTFALSQTASFYQAQVGPKRISSTVKQDQHTPQGKSVVTESGQSQQLSLLPAPPFYTLQTLRHPPPTQSLPKNNFIVTVLAVVSWTGTSLLHRAGSPFPPKRHLKIVDPSLSASRPQSRDTQLSPHVQALANTSAARSSSTTLFKPQTTFQDSVTVAVYVDAADFKPASGTIALFRGLVMQRLANGDIILNAYGRLKDQRFAADVVDNDVLDSETETAVRQGDNFNHWYITDPDKIRALGYGGKLDYYREWWNRKQMVT